MKRTTIENIITSENSSIFQTFIVDEYIWGYNDTVAMRMEEVFPGTFDDTAFGIFYRVCYLPKVVSLPN